ncbi:MAG: PD-(D/E)XK nuclease family protein [Candidatus Magasanikbacteria bacterium]
MPDKYTATWVSHSSISDWLACPRAYYLKNVYKDPRTNHKIKLMSPALALGSAVHEVLESLSVLAKGTRFSDPLQLKFDEVWKKYTGKRGGFVDEEVENKFKQRGADMLRRVYNHPGPISGLAVKIQMDLPWFWLSEAENIILCGKVDWLEYLPETDSVHIIDFKTGRSEESGESLQLPIYLLLVNKCQKRKVSKVSYWYLDSSDVLTERPLPDLETATSKILAIASQIKLARQINRFKCPGGEEGCGVCRPYEAIARGEGELVGQDDFGADVYILARLTTTEDREGVIL